MNLTERTILADLEQFSVWLYDGLYGIANDVLIRLHVIEKPIILLVRPELTIWAMVAAEIWKTTPFMALPLLAGLQLIPRELYEAAALDGASRWQAFWRVTLPILKPTILVALLFRTIDAVRMFDLPRVLHSRRRASSPPRFCFSFRLGTSSSSRALS